MTCVILIFAVFVCVVLFLSAVCLSCSSLFVFVFVFFFAFCFLLSVRSNMLACCVGLCIALRFPNAAEHNVYDLTCVLLLLSVVVSFNSFTSPLHDSIVTELLHVSSAFYDFRRVVHTSVLCMYMIHIHTSMRACANEKCTHMQAQSICMSTLARMLGCTRTHIHQQPPPPPLHQLPCTANVIVHTSRMCGCANQRQPPGEHTHV